MTHAVCQRYSDQGEGTILLFAYQRIGQHSQALYFNRDRVSRLHKHRWSTDVANTRRGTRQDNVPRLERRDRRNVTDDVRNAKDHICRVAVLHHLTIQDRLDAQLIWIGYLVAGDQRRA